MAGRDYGDEVRGIVHAAQERANQCMAEDDLQEAKRVLSNAVRQIKDVKRDIKEQERAVRESYQDARQKNAAAGQTVGLFVSSKTRGSMARARAAQGRKISAEKTRALRTFADVYADIDHVVRSLDHEKAKLTDEIARRRGTVKSVAFSRPTEQPSKEGRAQLSADGPPPQAQSLQAATWAPDPLHRHELRYWDGATWTEHVADQGRTAVDPM
jgi:hypothetical protein